MVLFAAVAIRHGLWLPPAAASRGDPAAAAVTAQVARQAAAFEFALMGDLPYTAENETMFPALMADVNRAPLAFVVHNGDFTWTRCGNDLFAERLAAFQASEHPLIFVPGDNDWTDCHRASDGVYDPVERLNTLRETFYPSNATLGRRTLQLARQSEDPAYGQYRENTRWGYGPVLFVAINMPGSNNNLGRTPEMDDEHYERNAANLMWMAEGFDVAKRGGYRGVVVIAHANPGFEIRPHISGYADFLAALEREVLAFPGPVVLVHADTHYFRVDKPLVGSVSGRRMENLTRVEVFGAPDSHWVRATMDPQDPELFRFRSVMVQENLIDHSVPETGGFATRDGRIDPPRVR